MEIMSAKRSISASNESFRDINYMIQEVVNEFSDFKSEDETLSKLTAEINKLDKYISNVYDILKDSVENIRKNEEAYKKELENTNFENSISFNTKDSNEEEKCYQLSKYCEEIELELSRIHNQHAILLEKKKQLLKSMRDSEEMFIAKRKMYQNISSISWSSISELSLKGHFIPPNAPHFTESFQLQLSENNRITNADYLWGEIKRFV
ncbi:uncharacterized protein CMU_016310 [Cryptosporidium muris RN66]|uniref:Uncharacterized protein n=1 Tax=Cryptosporidium muris (strain RN66) TaxID=441375 RepID=B6ACM8_CRYMR|nr:uncharacterized protein CMU_016310 [Cryptosporidium muris RN66]EEA05882.1 hypothetical protein CMU_016310 [Cryptosporidium muris RN66]|eukprot:XP_002140231.1 hypothetical protein [Cryptosporidium muris RN66]